MFEHITKYHGWVAHMKNNKNWSNFIYNPKKQLMFWIYKNTKKIIIIPIGWFYSLFTVFPTNRLIKQIKILRLINP